jgi:hypothetical protein
MKALDTFTHRGLTVEIHTDLDCPSPRDDDNLGTIIAWSREFQGDDGDHSECTEYQFNPTDYAVCLPIYYSSHGPMCSLKAGTHNHAILTQAEKAAIVLDALVNPAGDDDEDNPGMERGQDGWVYLSHESLKKEYGADIEAAIRCMVAEVETYGQWLSGECYGYIIKEPDVEDENGDEEDGEELSACWGFIGYDDVKQAAKEDAESIAKQRAKAKRKGAKLQKAA